MKARASYANDNCQTILLVTPVLCGFIELLIDKKPFWQASPCAAEYQS